MESVEQKSKRAWEKISTLDELREVMKDVVRNKLVSPWYGGFFNDPNGELSDGTSDNKQMTNTFASQFLELHDMSFLTTDSQLEMNGEVEDGYAFYQKPYIAGWMPTILANVFLDEVNAQPGLIGISEKLPRVVNPGAVELKLGVTWKVPIDAKTGKANDLMAVEMISRRKLLHQGDDLHITFPDPDWRPTPALKNVFAFMKEILVIGTDPSVPRGSLLKSVKKLLQKTISVVLTRINEQEQQQQQDKKQEPAPMLELKKGGGGGAGLSQKRVGWQQFQKMYKGSGLNSKELSKLYKSVNANR